MTTRSVTNSLDTTFLARLSATNQFRLGRPADAYPTPDGSAVLFLRATAEDPRQSLYRYDVASGETSELLTPDMILFGAQEELSAEERARRERQRNSAAGFTTFQVSSDSASALVTLSGKLYLVSVTTGAVRPLHTGTADVLDPKFSPDCTQVSFIFDHDIYVLDLASNNVRAVTSGGTTEVSHGEANFLAQEELARLTGYWWSFDSGFIVYERASSAGELWHFADAQHPETAGRPVVYPLPGKAIPTVELGVIPVTGGETVWVDWDRNLYPYLVTVTWKKNCPLTLTVMTRDQKEILLLEADSATGAVTTLVKESDETWVNYHQDAPHWLSDGSGFLWITEADGGPQLELRNRQGEIERILVRPGVGNIEIVDADVDAGVVHYLATPNATQKHLFQVPLSGGQPVAITTDDGLHDVTFAGNHRLYVRRSRSLTSMPQTFCVDTGDDAATGALPSVAQEPPFVPNVQLVTTKGPRRFHACIVRPREFDKRKRYPVIVDVYGGPAITKVMADMSLWLVNQWIADQGFIVVTVDGRGTPNRDRAWERAIVNLLGDVPLEDQVDGIQQLCQMFPELDSTTVGITGRSFGGYLSTLAALRRPDVFKAAVARCLVADWHLYDACYTERYLRSPESNEEAYTKASLLTYAAGLQVPLMVVHGTADDNVYFRHSLDLADVLIKAVRPFDFIPLPGAAHGMTGPVFTQYLWTRTIAFFKTHLGEPRRGRR
jgi:dipeptidyl-peptidase-4